MSSVRQITGAMLVLVATTGALHAQATGSQDTSRTTSGSPWPVKRIPGTFPSDTTTTQAGAAIATDATHIREAVSGNAAEVELGRLAGSRAADDDVKEFAERMVTDHEAMGRQWATLARTSRVTVTAGRDPAAAQTVERLESLSGTAFDRAYMTEMVRHHEQELVRLQQVATSASSPEVRRLAAAGQTTVREHASLARQVASQVGVSTVATGDTERDRRDTSLSNRDDRDRNRGADRAFMTRLLNDHQLQVRLARRAAREARSDETRRFAERLAGDFAWWQERWSEVASRQEVRTSSGLDRQDAQKVERLERASGQQVDRVYAALVVEELEALIAELRDQRQADRSEAVQRVVDNELPVMREHLVRARKLQAQASAQAGGKERN